MTAKTHQTAENAHAVHTSQSAIAETVHAYVDPSTLAGAAILGLVFFVLATIMSWVVRRAVREALMHDKSDKIDTISLEFISRLAILGVWLMMGALYAHLVPELNKLGTALLAGAGLASVVIGFAAQTTLSNLVAGISLILYKPFKRGDRLQVTAPTKDQWETGVVEDISLGYTLLRTDDGRKIIVANATMAQQTMIKLLDAPEEETGKVSAAITTKMVGEATADISAKAPPA